MSYRIEYQPQLVEEAVLRAIAGHAAERDFRKERDRVYMLSDEDERENAFQGLHQAWYERLELDQPLGLVLAHWPIITRKTCRCIVLKAPQKKQIGAELFVSHPKNDHGVAPEHRSVTVQLTPELAANTEPCLHFLRHEFLHIVDMLDPVFGYQPSLPASELGPTYDRLLQQRYRILWDVSVGGRLQQQGLLPGPAGEQYWTVFGQAFDGPSPALEEAFSFFFETPQPRHEDLVSFALAPEKWFKTQTVKSKGLCPLCHFPSCDLKHAATTLPPHVLQAIKEERPDWKPDDPVCQQCMHLFEARAGEKPAPGRSGKQSYFSL